MIVKIQLPQSSNQPDPPALIYNEKRDFQIMVPVNETIKMWMQSRPKAFFKVRIDADGDLIVVEEARWQEW